MVRSIGPELADHVHALQRVLEELVVPVDPRLARPPEELVPHDLVPEVVDLLDLGEEAVSAEVEAIAVAHLGAGDAAHLIGRLEHDHRLALLGQQIAGGQPGGAAAQREHGVLGGDLVAPGGAGLEGFAVMSGTQVTLVEDGAVGHAAGAAVVVRSPGDLLELRVGCQDRTPLGRAAPDQLRPRRLPILAPSVSGRTIQELLAGFEASEEWRERACGLACCRRLSASTQSM